MAALSGVSRAMISRIERDESSPTATILGKLSGALELSISTLLRTETEHPGIRIGTVRRASDLPLWRDPETGYQRRQLSPAGFPTDLTEVLLPPGAQVSYPAAAYAFIRQLVWVISGDLVLIDHDRRHELHPGDVFQLGEPAARQFHNPGSVECRYVVAVARRDEA
ncbi:XRE family transcriptional regulator [Gryllotalpicola daejeonensis]|uniref:XRE family transcriptional regulator n=1 Tax=Gryllotalpicola daejeonensis TaxID=993087 RepID=A0ABP7ZJT6_9MICO